MRAASYSSPGMVCRPESQMIMWKPTACQIDMTMIAGSAVCGIVEPVRALMTPKLERVDQRC